jgi:hypothetical protein
MVSFGLSTAPDSLPQVRLQAVIRPRLDGDTNAFDLA